MTAKSINSDSKLQFDHENVDSKFSHKMQLIQQRSSESKGASHYVNQSNGFGRQSALLS